MQSKGKFITADCCSYGADGKGSDYDCLRIPSVELTKGTLLKAHSGFCGNGKRQMFRKVKNIYQFC